MKSATAIAFDLRPSRLLTLALALLAALAVTAIWLSRLGQSPLIAAAASAVVALLVRQRVARLWQLRWRRLGWNADGNWLLLDAAQAQAKAELRGWSALGLVLLLRLRTAGGENLSLQLLPDNLDRDTRRRLRIRLEQESGKPLLPPTLS
jgi:toxin CptA